MVFMCLAITPPKVNQYGWNLEQCESNMADFKSSVATVWEGSFSKKLQKLLTKFPGLATSGHHNFTMITNAENSQPNGPPTGCLVSICTIRITSKSFLWAVCCAPESDLPKSLAVCIVWYCPIVRCSAGAAHSHRYGSGTTYQRYIEEKQTELETESK